MSFLIDTDLLSMLERRRVPAKLAAWMSAHDGDIFLSVVSLAEIQHGINAAPATHQVALTAWLDGVRRDFAAATEPLDEPVLARWKALLKDLKTRNRTMTCEDSLIAATALHHGLTLATHNSRHFSAAGVVLVDPLPQNPHSIQTPYQRRGRRRV